jgi:hypothetical protein
MILAIRVPRFPDTQLSWVGSVPPHITAKLLAKDFYLLLPAISGVSVLLLSIPLQRAVEHASPFFVFLDGRLYSRPPPTA